MAMTRPEVYSRPAVPKELHHMKSIFALAIVCAFAPSVAAAQDGHGRTEPAPRVRNAPPPGYIVAPAPGDIVFPGVLRQDLFDRNNPNNLRHDYPAPPAQPG